MACASLGQLGIVIRAGAALEWIAPPLALYQLHRAVCQNQPYISLLALAVTHLNEFGVLGLKVAGPALEVVGQIVRGALIEIPACGCVARASRLHQMPGD